VICNTFPRFLAAVLLLAAVGAVAGTPPSTELAAADAAPQSAPSSPRTTTAPQAKTDISGHKRTGKASYYGKKFTGQKMADGTRMDPHSDNAASKTLPLGTTAKVTNTETGQSAQVTIQDRGPYVKGRIIDLSPKTAREIGLDRHDGIATVVVTPIEVPLPDGGLKRGAAAGDRGAIKRPAADKSK